MYVCLKIRSVNGILRRTVEGKMTIVHWEPCSEYKALEELVKANLIKKLAPCSSNSYCTETYIATKEELLSVMKACKRAVQGVTNDLKAKARTPLTPPTMSMPQYFD
jgi:hypothetical protein